MEFADILGGGMEKGTVSWEPPMFRPEDRLWSYILEPVEGAGGMGGFPAGGGCCGGMGRGFAGRKFICGGGGLTGGCTFAGTGAVLCIDCDAGAPV
jgi:hypothetical protein